MSRSETNKTMNRIQSLTAAPGEALQPTAIRITAAGFAAGEAVRIASRRIDDAGVTWAAHGNFIADHHGTIDLDTAPSESGTYTGTDRAGLFWSMLPTPVADRSFMINAAERSHKLGVPHFDPIKTIEIELTAHSGDTVRASTTVRLTRLADGVELLPVRDGRLRGMLLRWKDRSRQRGAIMSLTGSGGGVEMGYAPLLASLGYDVLSLAYFAYEDLPSGIASIPLEYFEEGFQWMQRELKPTCIAIQGASRGGELTVALASYLPQYVKGAIAIVPMYASSAGWDPEQGVAGPSWTFRGENIPFAPSTNLRSLEDMKRLGDEALYGYAATPDYRADLDRPEVRANAALPIERAGGPLLLISGKDDQMWPCAWGADRIVDRLRAKGFAHPYRHLALDDTGHITPTPNMVTSLSRAVYHSLANVFLACGGSPAGAALASRQTWDAMVEHYQLVFGDAHTVGEAA